MIDPNKKYRTKAGDEVTHLHRAPEGWPTNYPWRGIIDGCAEEWTDEGLYRDSGITTDYDLVEVREPREFWVNYYGENNGYAYESKRTAEFAAQANRKEIIRVREVLEP